MGQHLFDEAFPDPRASRKRRALVAVAVVAVAGVAVALASLSPSDARCDGAAVRSFVADRRIHHSAIAEVCRFDEPLAGALRDLGAAPPSAARQVTLRAIVGQAGRLDEACPAARRALAEASELAPEDSGAAFAARCDLSRIGPLSPGELAAAGAPRLALALIVHAVLAATDPEVAAPLARRFAQGP